MGAKTSMLAIVEGDAAAILRSRPVLDREACQATVRRLFPGQRFDPLPDGDLSNTYPRNGELYVACFPGLVMLAHDSLATEPGKLDRRFLDFAGGRTVLLHTMISTVDCFIYGVWEKGRLCRALAMDADNGVTEDIGPPRAFEAAYWAGEHRHEEFDQDGGGEPYAGGIPFHPLDMAEAALLDLFGYQLEGFTGDDEVEPESIPVMRFAPARPRWKFW